MEDLTGIRIDRYQIEKVIGSGGMAIVYLAQDVILKRRVALKIIRKAAFPPKDYERLRKRFLIEAKTLALLDHPNIVKIYDYGEYDGAPYLVMEYVSGGTLKQKMGMPLPFNQAAEMLAPIADGLHYAHQQGVLHRDVKPANILLRENGTPVLTDFGIAKMLDAEDGQGYTGLTEANMGVGTPDYMSPEQCLGRDLDGRADEYSLGLIFFEMCSGVKPYTAPTATAIMMNQINAPIPELSSYVGKIPSRVSEVVRKSLAKKPDDRYRTAGEYAAALRGLAQLKPKSGTPSRELPLIKPSGQDYEETIDIYTGTHSQKSPVIPEIGKKRLPVFVLIGILAVLTLAAGGLFILKPDPIRELFGRMEKTAVPETAPVQAATETPVPTNTEEYILPEASLTPTQDELLSSGGKVRKAPEIKPKNSPVPTETPVTPTSTATLTETPVTPTLTATLMETPVTPTLTATLTETAVTPTLTATLTETPVTPTLTATLTETPVTPTLTPTLTETPVTPTLTATLTETPVTPTLTAILTETPVTPTLTATLTETPVTPTLTATLTETPVTPTLTATLTLTATPVTPTVTPTPVTPTATLTPAPIETRMDLYIKNVTEFYVHADSSRSDSFKDPVMVKSASIGSYSSRAQAQRNGRDNTGSLKSGDIVYYAGEYVSLGSDLMLLVKTASDVTGYVYSGYLSVIETPISQSRGNSDDICRSTDVWDPNAGTDIVPGQVIVLGNYNYTPLQWQAVSVDEDGTALLISQYLIDILPYNSNQGYNTTWENSSLRSWLNKTFLNEAFSEAAVHLLESPNNGCLSDDKVSLLSKNDVRSGQISFGTDIYSNCWVLDRSSVSSDRAYYMNNGIYEDSFHETVTNSLGVRPVIRVNMQAFRTASPEQNDTSSASGQMQKAAHDTAQAADPIGHVWNPYTDDRIQPGNLIKLGTYESKTVQWRVLDHLKDGRLFLISDRVLTSAVYHTENRSYTTWEISSIREWLNSDFLDEVFPDDSPQRELLSETTLENGLNYDKKGVAGMTTPSTTDLVFLLSVPEVMEYESLLMLDDPDTEFWLRSQGGDNTRGVFPVFSENAEATFNGSTEVAKAKGIRPAIMVDMDKLQALYADGCSLLHAGDFEAAAESLKYTELWNDILEALYEENKMERSDTPVIRFLLDNMNEDGIAEIRSNALFTDILPEVQSGDIVRFGKEVVKKSNSTVFEGDTPGSTVSKVTDTAMNMSAKQNLLIRQSASDNADVLWAAAKGDPLIFIERGANDWIRVQSENGVVGWVHEDFLQYGKIVESVDMKTLDTGDFFYYGSYEQDGTGSQEIEWQVLTAEKDRILVISRYGLETMPYHDTAVNVTWETSSLRSWLNGTFLNTAFSDEEKSHIAVVTHGSAANPDHKTPGGDETTDRIFILDLNEVQRYMVLNADRFCAPTEHARNNGAYSDYYVYRTYWWLRTPGVSANTAVYVNQAGDTYVYGKYVNDGTVTVRPAFWLAVD